MVLSLDILLNRLNCSFAPLISFMGSYRKIGIAEIAQQTFRLIGNPLIRNLSDLKCRLRQIPFSTA